MPARIFGGIAAAMTVLMVVYWFVSYEDIGTTLLIAAAVLAVMCGLWLYLQERRIARADADLSGAGLDHGQPDLPYLPTSSPWPLAMGCGAALLVNGLVLTWPYALPGVLLLGVSIVGFVAQGRRRA